MAIFVRSGFIGLVVGYLRQPNYRNRLWAATAGAFTGTTDIENTRAYGLTFTDFEIPSYDDQRWAGNSLRCLSIG